MLIPCHLQLWLVSLPGKCNEKCMEIWSKTWESSDYKIFRIAMTISHQKLCWLSPHLFIVASAQTHPWEVKNNSEAVLHKLYQIVISLGPHTLAATMTFLTYSSLFLLYARVIFKMLMPTEGIISSCDATGSFIHASITDDLTISKTCAESISPRALKMWQMSDSW